MTKDFIMIGIPSNISKCSHNFHCKIAFENRDYKACPYCFTPLEDFKPDDNK